MGQNLTQFGVQIWPKPGPWAPTDPPNWVQNWSNLGPKLAQTWSPGALRPQIWPKTGPRAALGRPSPAKFGPKFRPQARAGLARPKFGHKIWAKILAWPGRKILRTQAQKFCAAELASAPARAGSEAGGRGPGRRLATARGKVGRRLWKHADSFFGDL